MKTMWATLQDILVFNRFCLKKQGSNRTSHGHPGSCIQKYQKSTHKVPIVAKSIQKSIQKDPKVTKGIQKYPKVPKSTKK
jgi:hypothetical protein